MADTLQLIPGGPGVAFSQITIASGASATNAVDAAILKPLGPGRLRVTIANGATALGVLQFKAAAKVGGNLVTVIQTTGWDSVPSNTNTGSAQLLEATPRTGLNTLAASTNGGFVYDHKSGQEYRIAVASGSTNGTTVTIQAQLEKSLA